MKTKTEDTKPMKMISKLVTAWATFEVWEHGVFIIDRDTAKKVWITKDKLQRMVF